MRTEMPVSTTIHQAKAMKTPQITGLIVKRERIENGISVTYPDKSECYVFINLMINDIFNFFGAQLSTTQNLESLKLIYSAYWHLTIAEWKLFVIGAKTLKFGPVYPNISMAKLMEWLQIFCSDVDKVTDEIANAKHLKNTQDEKFSNHERQGERDLRREKDEQFAKFKYKPSEPIESEPKPKRSQAEIDAEYEKFINEYKNKNNG
jgi:hypothetical protein